VIGLESLASTYVPTTVLQNPATPSTAHALIQPGATTVGSSNTIRSLTFESGGTLSQAASQTLAVTSGQVLVRSGSGPATLSGGTLAFGAQSGTVALFGDLVLTAAVTGSAGWTKVGPGVLTLGTQPTGAAALTIGTGAVRAFSATALDRQMLAFAGTDAVFDLAGSDTTVGGFNGTGSVNLGGATLTLGTSGEFFNFSGTFAGPGQVRIEDGGERTQLRILNLASKPGGATVTLASGRFEYRDANTTNPTALTLAGGALEIANLTTFRVPLVLTGNARIRGGSYFAIDSPATITGPGALHIDATTELSLRIAANHTGETIVSGNGGTRLRLEGINGSLTAPSPVRIRSGELYVDYGNSNAERLNDAAPIHLRNGILSATGPQDLTVIERTGALHAGPRSVLSLSRPSSFFSSSTTSVLDLRPEQIIREDHAALRISADYLGDVAAPQRIEIHPSIAPAMIGGGAASGTSRSIIPWIVARHFALRRQRDFHDARPYQGPAASNSLHRVCAEPRGGHFSHGTISASPATETLAAPLTVNSLLLSDHVSFATLNGTAPLTITSGAVLTDSIVATVNAPLNFGSQERSSTPGRLHHSQRANHRPRRTHQSGLQRDRPQRHECPRRHHSYPRGLRQLFENRALGADTVPVHFNGGALNYTGSPAATFAHPISLGPDGGSIGVTHGAGTLSVIGAD
jgi:hypothetical protein